MATADTDLEIANALYDNEYGTAGAYKFSYELSSTPASSAGLTIAGEKIRLRTDTDGTVTTAIEIDSSQNVILPSLPTSSAGLTSGALWSDSGTLKIVS